MRLNKQLEEIATFELRQILRSFPQGLTTTELMELAVTPLSRRQIAQLLRASGLVKHQYDGGGCKAASRWICKDQESQTRDGKSHQH